MSEQPTTEPPATPPPAPADPATEPQTEQPKPEAPKPAETVEFWKQKAREQESRAKSNADAAKRLKDIEDRDLSDLEKARRDATEATGKLAHFEQTTMRQRIALEKGMPASLVSRLQGSTEDEINADADALMLLIKAPVTPRPDTSQGARPSTPAAEADAEYERYYPNPTRK